ncbi:hypothetical protein M2132_001706 [Dysgonomonas sp. PH5-45]|uniref:hypothetical protein n=1 Tax=unclassified Dysgonomonas TaxID=2630389 RepID=UPI002476E1E4|nr:MULTISPECIES: hypothetical protein [unclassified Dysgonomonas]MDH6355365.1 hypothetical protein [Dysgonomonas sp. PH5-45]MDH6388263.1 hypothetical protein [Dysgonomonas sp. PH5-37]
MKKEMKKWHKLGFALSFVAIFAAAAAVVMLLWNALIPSIVGWTEINYWQSAGLMLLCRLLFSGFRPHGHRHKHSHKHQKHMHLHEMMRDMSREERRNFIRERMGKDFNGRENAAAEQDHEKG